MSSIVQKFINSKLQVLNSKYNLSFKNLTINYNNRINIVRRLVISAANKNKQISSLQIELNNKINLLRQQLKQESDKIKSAVVTKSDIINKRALLIGINYIGTPSELHGCINDVNTVENTITSLGFNHITKLTDETEQKPTRDNIINELTNILVGSSPGDLIFFLYSGHGSYVYDRSGDETDRRDEVIVPLDFKLITDDVLKSIVQTNLKEGVTLFAMFDSCNSGTVLDLRYEYLSNPNVDNVVEQVKNTETEGNVIMISGCKDDQYSYETVMNNQVNGAMTSAFNIILNENPNTTWTELVKNIRNLIKSNNFPQIIQLSSGKLFNIDTQVFL
jgi:hypothetical protein